MKLTGAELAKLLPTLDRAQVSVLTRTILGVTTKDRFDALGTADAVRAGVWEFLLAVGFVSEVQATLLLHAMRPALEDLSRVVDGGGTVLPTFRLTLAEKRWATWTVHNTWFDFYTQEHVDTLPEPPVLLVVCDVSALILRLTRWLEKVRSKDATRTKSEREPYGNGQPD